MRTVTRYFRTGFAKLWLVVIAPTSAIFLAAAMVLRMVVRHRIITLPGAAEVNLEAAFDATFPGWYIATGLLVACALATVWCFVGAQRSIIRPYAGLTELTKALSEGDYTVRADVGKHGSTMYQTMAASINALAESLERTDQVRRDMVVNSAHELRTPLTTIQGYLEALRDGVIEPDQQTLISVHDEVLRLVRLVDALQQLARADSRRGQPIQRTPTEVDAIAVQLVQIMRGHIEGRGIRLSLICGAQEKTIGVDADAVAQVMRNILRNAVQYTDDGGRIEVVTWLTLRGGYRFSCRNTGAGISTANLPYVFDRFFRTEEARERRAEGAGLGLAICKELVESHCGQLGASSESGWTTVWFEVPMTG